MSYRAGCLLAIAMPLLAGCAAGQPNLSGSTWRVVEFWDDNLSSMQTVVGQAPSVSFGSDSRISGTGGCNTYFGT